MLKSIVDHVKKHGAFVLGAVLLLTLAIRFAEPVKDGDFFWQVKYGEHMVENRTLIPDHARYSWTPADNKEVYCAWMSEIALYLMHQAGGMPLMFAFRYLCMFAVVFIVWSYARRMGHGRDILVFSILLIVLLSSMGAAFIKPEIFSMIFMALTAGLYFSVKSSLWEKWGTRPFLLYPLLFLLWVNIHGVFFFGLALLAMITVGEIVNYLFKSSSSLPKQGLRHLITGAVLSLAATFATPYGYRLHLHFYEVIVNATKENLGTKTVMAYKSLFSGRLFSTLHYLDFWVIMLISFIVVFAFFVWKKKAWDWGVLLPTLFLSFLYTKYLRSVYYWPPFWAMSLIYLHGGVGQGWPHLPKANRAFKTGVLLLFFFLAGRAMYDAGFKPTYHRWLGFGISYFNPVQASAFLKEHRPGSLLYNSYNVGGYLIYDLYPAYKVFCDARYFPYREWYGEYWDFNNGPTPLEDFMKEYPFDVALVDYYSSDSPIMKFLKSRQWEPVFYGPAAMVFFFFYVEFEHDFRESDNHRFDELRNLTQANMALFVAQNLGDLEASAHILQLIDDKLCRYSGYAEVVEKGALMHKGLVAYAEGDYATAFTHLDKVTDRAITVRATLALLSLRNWKCKELVKEGKYQDALAQLELTLKDQPSYVDGLYNAGVLGYQVEVLRKQKRKMDVLDPLHSASFSLFQHPSNWRKYLRAFLQLAPGHRHAWVARQLLEGKTLPANVPLIL